MKKSIILLFVLSLVLTTACKNDKKANDGETTETTEETSNTKSVDTTKSVTTDKITVILESKSGSTAKGNVVFRQRSNTVSMTAVFSGMEEGEHAVHLHEKSDCFSDDGHADPTSQSHGKSGDEGDYYKADIGNFTINANGIGTLTFITDEWCIGCGDETKDILGKVLVITKENKILSCGSIK